MPSLSVISLWRLSSYVGAARLNDSDTIQVQSLVSPNTQYAYSRRKLHAHRKFIVSMLARLPHTMRQSQSSIGERWIKAIYNHNGTAWGGIAEADKLLSIARAAHMVEIIAPSGLQSVCDMPFALILDNDIRSRERALPPSQQTYSITRWRFSN